MVHLRVISIIVFISLLGACTEETEMIPITAPDDNTSDFVVPNIVPSGDEQYLNLDSDYIYDQEELRTYEFLLPEAALRAIDNDPVAEQYVSGSLVFEGDTISPVGIRYKGSIGAFVGCTESNDFANPSGAKTCTKLSMKVKINWEGREEHFYGLKKLQFHSQNLNISQMRERLGYWLFREIGLPAPRSVHARLLINGEYSGLYALTEQIDGRFSRYNFPDGKGNVYKEVWPIDDLGNVQSEAYFLNGLKTNEDDNPSVDIIRSLGQDIASSSTSQLKSVVEKWMNVDEIIKYAVVDRAIRHDDGPFHWYCNRVRCDNHNYYWYEEPEKQKLHLIAWDLDNAFENIIFDSNPVTSVPDAWGEKTDNCAPFAYGLFGISQKSAACDKLTSAWVQYDDEYQNYKEEFINTVLTEERIDPLLQKWEDQIRPAMEEAVATHGDAVPISSWENALEILKTQIRSARLK